MGRGEISFAGEISPAVLLLGFSVQGFVFDDDAGVRLLVVCG